MAAATNRDKEDVCLGTCFEQSCCECTFHDDDESCPTCSGPCFCAELDEVDPGHDGCPNHCKCECTCEHRFHTEAPCDPRCSKKLGKVCPNTVPCKSYPCKVNSYAPNECRESRLPAWVLDCNEGLCTNCAVTIGRIEEEKTENDMCMICFEPMSAKAALQCRHQVCIACYVHLKRRNHLICLSCDDDATTW
jgi:hypothetical protein